jgi:uncharacterized metal-binding protein
MVKASKSAIRIVMVDECKELIHSNQKVLEVGEVLAKCTLVINGLPGRQQAPNPPHFFKRNVETPYGS